MSLTISGLIVVIIASVLGYFNITGVDDQINELIMNIGKAVGILISWYGRYKLGDISLVGIRKA